LKRLIVENFFLMLIYLALFYLLLYLLPTSLLVCAVIFIIIMLMTFDYVKSITKKIISTQISSIENKLNVFNNKLNSIVDYHELMAEYFALFNDILYERAWAFYVFEESFFKLTKTVSNNPNTNLPPEIALTIPLKNLEPVAVKNLFNAGKNGANFNKSVFLEKNLNYLIPIAGKSQIAALLFTTEQNTKFLTASYSKKTAYRVLSKSGQILENTGLYLDLLQKNLEIKKLFQVSEKILSTFNTDEILSFLLEVLYELSWCDAAAIFLIESESGKLHRQVSKGYNKNVNLDLKLGQGAAGWVAQNKKISLLEDVSKSDQYFPARDQTKSQVVLPLQIRNEIIGVLCLESDEIGFYTENSLELLNLFANQAAISLYNAKQHEISLEKKSLEHELINAGNVQQVLTPKRPPVFEHLSISFSSIPSKIVSGDLFDLVPMEKTKLGVMIGDVSGKGAGAAIMMSLVLAGFRAYKKTQFAVCEVVAKLNNLLEESTSSGNYATFFYTIISTDNNTLTFTNAGHNPPFLIRSDGTVEKLKEGGIVLGFLTNQTYMQKTVPFEKDDILFCYTDGLTEAMNMEEEEFGEYRILQILKNNRHLNSYELKTEILKTVRKFTGKKDIEDDQTMLIIKHV